MHIYLITNKVNEKQYVGQTTRSVKKRWQEHCEPGNTRVLGRAINKYGKENFSIEIIDTASSLNELNKKEISFINKFNTLSPKGYNSTTGGKNFLISMEAKEKMSKKKKGIYIPWNKGLTKKDDPRVGKQGVKGELNPMHGKRGYWLGKKMPKEAGLKISASKKGKTRIITEKVRLGWTKVGKTHRIKIICHQTDTIYDSIQVAADDLNIHQCNISRVINGKLKNIKGYTFSRIF